MNSSKNNFFSVKSELDLFTQKLVSNSIDYGSTIEIRPLNSLDSQGIIEFRIIGSDDYIDLSNSKLYIKVKITESGNKNITSADSVVPCNNFLNSLFTHVNLELNSKSVTTPSNAYMYRSFFETLLNYGVESKDTHLVSELFIKDEKNKFDDVTSKGFVKRKALMNNGEVELMGYLHNELCNQEKFLPSRVDLNFKFYRNDDSFSLMKSADDKKNYEIQILETFLLIRKCKINTAIALAHEKALLYGHMNYHINRVDCRIITLPSTIQNKCIDNIYMGVLPIRLYMAFVASNSVNGNINTNPYNFEHFNVSHIQLSSDVHNNIRPIKLNIKNKQFLESYMTLFESSNIKFSDAGNNISRDEYLNGYFLIGFDLSPGNRKSQKFYQNFSSKTRKERFIFFIIFVLI